MNLVENIKVLCTKKGISIPKLEKILSLSNGSIYNWNKSFPSIDKVIKVADYFEVSLDELVGRNIKSSSTITMAARSVDLSSQPDMETLLSDLSIIQRLGQYLSDMGKAELEKNK